MRTNKLALLPSLIKFPLMALLCLGITEAVMTPHALAGGSSAGGTVQSSDGAGQSDQLGRVRSRNATVDHTRISNGVLDVIRTMKSEESVRTIGDRSLFISVEKVSTIETVLSASGNEVGPAISALERQLSDELGGLSIDISLLDTSASDLNSAVTAANEIILSLNRADLIKAVQSPTFMAILRVLGAANQAATDDFSDIALVEGTTLVSLLSMRLR